MAVTYIMSAHENYNPDFAVEFQDATQPLYVFSDQQDAGLTFDFARRVIMYVIATAVADTALNTSGTTLWDGLIAIASGGTVDTTTQWNMRIAQKNIDTQAVTFYDVYNPLNVVPVNIGPSAVGTYSLTDGNPAPSTTIVLNGVTWTFVASGATGHQTNIQSTLRETLIELARNLNGIADASLDVAWYQAGAEADPFALQIKYKTAGTAGNAYTIGTGTYAGTPSGATLTGGAAGSDGTWQRMVSDDSVFGFNLPAIVNPYTNDVFVHIESCRLYHLRYQDNFSLNLSPLCPTYNPDNPVYPMGITENWVYAFEAPAHPFGAGPFYLYVVPTTFASEELILDQKLAYATFDFPAEINSSFFRWCLDHSGNLYMIVGQQSGGKDFKFYKFSNVTAAPWGGTVTGGGFTDVTPWTSSTGPNTDNSAYTFNAHAVNGNIYQQPCDRNLLYYMPATHDFVAITKNIYVEKTGNTTPAYDQTFYDCTYINVAAGLTFDYQHAFVTGYMSAAWAPTVLGTAAYAVVECLEHNLYLGYSDFNYGVDYTYRWIMFNCQPVEAGVVNNDIRYRRCVLVQYHFVSGAPPTVIRVIDEAGWDAAYVDYGNSMGIVGPDPVPVVYNSMARSNNAININTDIWVSDNALYDFSNGDFWWSGSSSFMYDLDPFFTPRASLNGGIIYVGSAPNPPFLRLSLGTRPDLGNCYIIERMDNREWPGAENTWCVDCGLSTTLTYPDATLVASSATGAGIVDAITIDVAGQGYSSATTARIEDPTGSGATLSVVVASGMISSVTLLTGGTNYTRPVVVLDDPAGLGVGAEFTVTLDNSMTFTASVAVFTSDSVGETIRMGNGRALVTAFTDSTHVTGNIVAPITVTIPNSGGVPLPQPSGKWSIAPNITEVTGLWHLIGFTVVGVADGAPISPRPVSINGSITLDTPASLITVGLAFTPQFQSLYLDGGSPTVQGQRKKVAEVTVRLDASGVDGIQGGSGQPTGSTQNPSINDMVWEEMTGFSVHADQNLPPYGSTIPPLWTGDVRQPVKGGFTTPGQVAFQQTLPLPMNITAIIPEGLEGDTPEQTYQPQKQRAPRGKPREGGQ